MIFFIRSLFNRPTAHQLQVQRVIAGARRLRAVRSAPRLVDWPVISTVDPAVAQLINSRVGFLVATVAPKRGFFDEVFE